MHVLIIDDNGGPSINNKSSYSAYIDELDDTRLSIITSKCGVSEDDKSKCFRTVEIDHIGSNGAMELAAEAIHKHLPIDIIYTKQEDLILRASHLRALLGLNSQGGLVAKDALLFRDKEAMKRHLSSTIIVPPFAKVFSPANVMQFVNEHGFPVIVKPTLGSASAGVDVLRNRADMEDYFINRFYGRIDEEGRCMDYSGDMIVEKFLEGAKMYHVNGYASDSKIVNVWPFCYISTNLQFTTGNAYGNVLIPTTDARHSRLVEITQRVLDNLPCPSHLMFHLELFEVDNDFVLCEIAARRPGGSIGPLIDVSESQPIGWFAEYEFRSSLGLPSRRLCRARQDQIPCGDLLIPLHVGTLTRVPSEPCPIPGIEYKQIAQVGRVYTGFSINTMNTCARLIARGSSGTSAATIQDMLESAKKWLDHELQYTPPAQVPSRQAQPES
ncbi:hypothetical protein SmJEL517_g04234 [Synchytrium microbalum]|uniref:ATP-grasp domain-containing protein n=1 Tax=Synchytrium microbalum TaxID=1806994 RepID=A0A507C036_9FUNG|nr:uncharacterized protein SmJEL517_g04234 [Synchytrium microbalum]TPX32728.1 hypothetical protein SmJEL517_g04234 [Synchytrium microbalum]